MPARRFSFQMNRLTCRFVRRPMLDFKIGTLLSDPCACACICVYSFEFGCACQRQDLAAVCYRLLMKNRELGRWCPHFTWITVFPFIVDSIAFVEYQLVWSWKCGKIDVLVGLSDCKLCLY